MKILITVGTTPFDNLIKAAEQQLSQAHQLTSQISEGEYKPLGHTYFQFTDDIESHYNDADLIISHGGAGTIYRVLELGKKLIIVPNLDRVDHHQLDICDFMRKNGHALACLKLDELGETVEKVQSFDFVPYKADDFTGISAIRDFLGLKSVNV
jgi:beta-1,4-N-acetylglucosaminyltransferase